MLQKVFRLYESKKFGVVVFGLVSFLSLFFFLQTCLGFIDPDLGWHLRFGQLVMRGGIPKTDPFSYSMPSYAFINHEWLTDIFLSKVYNAATLPALSFFFVCLALFSILLHFTATPKTLWLSLLFVCVAFSLRMFIGIRPQVFSWFLFSCLWFVIIDRKLWKIARYMIPLLFLLWANLHGGFPMGLALIFLITVSRQFTKKQEDKTTWILFIFSLMATLCNPYGLALWREIFVSILDPSLRWSIQEWLPSFATANLILWAYIAGSSILFVTQVKKLSYDLIVVYIFFLGAALSSVRHLPFWLIISIPITIQTGVYFYYEVKKVSYGEKRLQKAFFFVVSLLVILYAVHKTVNHSTIPQVNEVYYYPTKAVTYLQKNLPKDNIFSFYGWGGYLIWKIPEKKVFVDGRMPSWKQDPLPSESTNAFKEHNEIFEGTYPVKKAIQKYHISLFLLPIEQKSRKKAKLIDQIFKTKKETPDIYEQLHNLRWKIVYQDTVAVIYSK